MLGYSVITKVDTLRSLANDLGFLIKPHYDELGKSRIWLINDREVLPTYIVRSFVGTLEEAIAFLQGIRYARFRDNNIGLVSFEQRDRAIKQRIQEAEQENAVSCANQINSVV